MRIGLLSDLHYSSALLTCGKRHNSEALERLKNAFSYFKENHCDLAIVLGDLTDREQDHSGEIGNLVQIRQVLDDAPFETVCLMGNHDAFLFSQQEFYDILGQRHAPHAVFREGAHLLFLDTCYPHAASLRKMLQGFSGEAYLFMHQNIDPHIRADHCLCNAEEIRAILEESGVVEAVYQGHYHPGHEEICNQIRYVTLPALCEQENAYWILDIPQ